jgi:hypothetical protein
MKTKIFVFIFCILLIADSQYAQNIINTLDISGFFTIKDASTNYFTLSQSTGQVNILNTLRLENTINSATGVIYKGGNRFLHNYGNNNLFMGINSGNFTMTGYNNTAIGNFSFLSNTTGTNNSAFGESSLSNNTEGIYNSAFGNYSLYLNISGYGNSAFGNQSMTSNTLGFENSAFGNSSLYSNTYGSYNSAFGTQSLSFNTTGGSNAAFGNQSLYSNTEGYQNSAFGYQSLNFNTTGNQNSTFGNQSLYHNIMGNENTAFGVLSLFNNINGSQNTAFGVRSLFNSIGNYNTAVGYNAGSTITTGSNLTCIGIDAAPTSSTAVNQITLGNIFVSSLRCNVTTITSLSDARDKKNIKDLSLGINFLMKIKPRIFNWDKREWYEDNISDGSKTKVSPSAGFIAQELDEIQTTENAEWLNLVLKDNPEKWEATPGNLFPIVVKAIQDLKTENDELKTACLTATQENNELKERLTKLEETQNILALEIETIKSSITVSREVKVTEK